MTKFTFKDTGKEIKVGDAFYYIGYEKRYSNGTRFITEIVASCKVQDINNLYKKDRVGFFSKGYFLITDNINNPTFTINDCLYSSQEACNDAMEIGKLQEVISQDVFAIHDIDKLKEINNLIKL